MTLKYNGRGISHKGLTPDTILWLSWHQGSALKTKMRVRCRVPEGSPVESDGNVRRKDHQVCLYSEKRGWRTEWNRTQGSLRDAHEIQNIQNLSGRSSVEKKRKCNRVEKYFQSGTSTPFRLLVSVGEGTYSWECCLLDTTSCPPSVSTVRASRSDLEIVLKLQKQKLYMITDCVIEGVFSKLSPY